VQRSYDRGCRIVGEQGSILWDFGGKAVQWYDAATAAWTTFPQPEGWELNQMYVDEMKHFLQCLREQRPTALPIPDAVSLMGVVFAAKESARQGAMVAIAGAVTV